MALPLVDIAATLAAVLQGGYVLARAADSAEPFNRAIDGVLDLLASRTVSRWAASRPGRKPPADSDGRP